TNTLIIPNSEVNLTGVYGVLKLTLADGSYAWQFIAASGTSRDTGNGTCHRSPATGPVMPLVNAGQDRLAHPGDSVRLSVTFTDPGPSDAPWSYSIAWGDGSPATSGNAASQSAPITASHVYSALGLDSVRVGVTNAPGITGWDTVAVQLVTNNPPVVFAGAGDIADCSKTGDSLTANLLDTIPGTVFTVGDKAYPRNNGCAPTSQRTRCAARSPTSIIRSSAPGPWRTLRCGPCGRPCTTGERTSCSTAMIMTTSGSRRRPRRAWPTRSTGSASSSWAWAALACSRSGRPRRTHRCGTT